MKTRTTLVLRAILALSLGIAFLAMNTVGTPTADANIENVKRSTVSIAVASPDSTTGYLWIGSGWIDEDKTTVVTAAHVVGGLSEFLTMLDYHVIVKPYKVDAYLPVNQLVRYSSSADVALLTLQSPYHEVPGLTIDSNGPSQKAEVTSVGTPGHPDEDRRIFYLGPEGTTKSGKVVATFVEGFPYVFKVEPNTLLGGMSGGPTVLNHGVVVGVNSMSDGEAAFIVNSSHVLTMMRYSPEIRTTSLSSGIPLDGRDALYLAGVGSLLIRVGRDDLAQKYMRRLSTQGSRGARFLRYLRLLIRLR